MYGQTEYGQIEDEENDLWPAERELLCPELRRINYQCLRL
jgi:hypothetical protein